MRAGQKKRRAPKTPPLVQPTDPAEQALLDGIRAAPDEDPPRLVYADFLEARGDTRGELIQLECQIARMADDDERKPALVLRASELNRLYAKDWLAPLWALGLPKTKFGFRRGCVETIAAPLSVVTGPSAGAIMRLAPMLASFELSVDGQADREGMRRPRSAIALVHARQLVLRGRHAGNTRFGQGPIGDFRGLAPIQFQRLESLSIDKFRTNPTVLGPLLASPYLANLKELSLTLSLGSWDIIALLAQKPACMALERIDLSRNPLDDDGVTLLARANIFDSVKDLRLVQTRIGRAGLSELLEGDRLRNIECLWLAGNGINDEGALQLAAWRGGPNLTELDLRGCPVTERGKEALLRSPQRAALRSLILSE